MNKKSKIFLTAILFFILFGVAESSWAAITFNEDFEGNAPNFGFGWIRGERVDGNCSNPAWGTAKWCLEKLDAGGWNGSGGAHLVTRAGERQYDFGWYDISGWQGGSGDSLFLRLRIKYDNDFLWDGEGALSNKMIMIGHDYANSNRMIFFNRRPHPTVSCALDPDPDPISHLSGNFSAGVGITTDCVGSEAMTRDNWYNIQVEYRCGNDGAIKMWINNNNYDVPSEQRLNVPIMCGDWSSEVRLGGFQTDYPNQDQGWVVDDFQIADTFSDSWYPSGQPDPTPPASPYGLTIR